MGVFSKDNPEELIGMKPEELKAKLESAASKEDLKALQTQNETLSGSLNEIKEALAKLTAPPPVVEEPDTTDPRDAMLLDPQGFVSKQTQPLAKQQAETQASLNELRARQNPEYANIFSQYGNEISTLANKFTPEQRAQPGFYDWHIKTFLGHKMITREIKPDAYPSLLGSSSVGPNDGDLDRDPNKGFDAEVAGFLKNRGVDLDKASRIHKLMNKDGEPITLQNYKAANA